MTDPEDFEFRPLTEGLGFQKKKKVLSAENVKASFSDSSPFDLPLKASIYKVEEGFDEIPKNQTDALFRDKLPGFFPNDGTSILGDAEIASTPEKDGIPESAVDQILKDLRKSSTLALRSSNTGPAGRLNDVEQKGAEKQTKIQHRYKYTTHHPLAIFLDGLLVAAISLSTLIILMLVTNVNLTRLWNGPSGNSLIVSNLAIVMGFTLIYLLATRICLGATPGEWSFDIQLGKTSESQTPIYPVKVFIRSVLVVMTGFVFFPILSWILGYDVLGKICDLRLIERKY